MKKRLLTKAGVILILFIIASMTLCGCGLNKTKEDENPIIDITTFEGMKEASVLQYPATNTSFRYNVYTHYVTVSECLTTDANVVIPDKIADLPVISVEASAFVKNTTLVSLTMGKNVYSIGNSAFASCTSMETVTLSPVLTEVGQNVFSGCSRLKSVIIPKTLKIINSNMFGNCTSLVSVTIEESDAPDRVIKGGAFSNCTNLQYIWLPKDVVQIESSSLSNSLNKLTIYGYAASPAATFSSVHLVDYVVLNKVEFQRMVKSNMNSAPVYPTVGNAIQGDKWKITLTNVIATKTLGNLTASDGNTYMLLYFDVQNTTNKAEFFNGLNVYGYASGYSKKLSFTTKEIAGCAFLAQQISYNEVMQGYLMYEVNENYQYVSVDFTEIDSFNEVGSVLAVYPQK